MKLFRLLALAAFILVFCALSELRAATDEQIGEQTGMAILVMPIIFQSWIPEDAALISGAVNRIAIEKIGASIECVPTLHVPRASSASRLRMAEYNLLKRQGIEFDIVTDSLPDVRYAAIDSYLPRYGKDILELVDEGRLDVNQIDGIICEIPSVSDYVASAGVTMRKDIVDLYNIDISSVNSMSDMDKILDFVHSREPELKMIGPYTTRSGFLNRMRMFGAVPNTVFDLDPADGRIVVNYYATDEYRDRMNLFRKWHEQGYLPDNMALQSIRASQLVSAGKLFAYFTSYKPDIDYEESISCGREMVTVPIIEPMVTRSSQSITNWGVSETCRNPEKAVQFLNLLYSDPEIVNLLVYGVEGIHYEKKPDGTIGYPDGVDSGNSGYINDAPYFLPNQFLEDVWEGNDPMLREKMKEYSESAKKSEALHFRLDDSGIAAGLSALNEIADQYAYGLETGQLDPDVYLAQLLKEMGDAGAGEIIIEVQKQYDLYLAGK